MNLKKLISFSSILVGAGLLLEHLFSWGGFDIEIIGHEYLGLGLIVFGFLLSIKWSQLKDIKKFSDMLDEAKRRK